MWDDASVAKSTGGVRLAGREARMSERGRDAAAISGSNSCFHFLSKAELLTSLLIKSAQAVMCLKKRKIAFHLVFLASKVIPFVYFGADLRLDVLPDIFTQMED